MRIKSINSFKKSINSLSLGLAWTQSESALDAWQGPAVQGSGRHAEREFRGALAQLVLAHAAE